MNNDFKQLHPCTTCPYRKDAKLQLWAKDEYAKLLKNEADTIGVVYGCHKKNGHACTGWMLDQVKRGCPSIALRLELIKQQIHPDDIEKMHSSVPMYLNVQKMIEANYPELL